MKRRSRIGKAFMILLCVVAFVVLFTFIVMSLWNAILPAVLGVSTITFWQAMGILVLSKILFGGFGGWQHKREHFKNRWRQRMQEKWANMTPEQKEKFKDAWKSRCGAGWRGAFDEESFNTKASGTE
jgi:Ca2+/H+ antiporter, TMEM165/GDT1 family